MEPSSPIIGEERDIQIGMNITTERWQEMAHEFATRSVGKPLECSSLATIIDIANNINEVAALTLVIGMMMEEIDECSKIMAILAGG